MAAEAEQVEQLEDNDLVTGPDPRFLCPFTHRGLDLAAPGDRESPPSLSIRSTRLVRRDLLGGLIHEYLIAA